MAEKVKKETSKKKYDKSTAFDLGKFDQSSFEIRTAELKLPDLKDFYPENTEPYVKMKGLSSYELAKVDDAIEINRAARADLLGAGMAVTDNVVSALKTILNAHGQEDTPDNHVRMLHYVACGLLEPKMTFEQVVKFADAFPIEFRQIFNRISLLTGKGKNLVGKQKDSTKTQQ